MASIFEDLMLQNKIDKSALTESVQEPVTKVNEAIKKFKVSKFKFESRKILESATPEEITEIDAQFAVNPESEEEGEVVLVIDPEVDADADIPEDEAEEAIGDYVYKCPVCGSNYLCDCDPDLNEAVEVDENGIPKECPICGDDSEQILIGEITPVEDAGEEEKVLEPVEPEDAEDNEEILGVEEEEGIEDEENLDESVKEGCSTKKKSSRKRKVKESTDEDKKTISVAFDISVAKDTTEADIDKKLKDMFKGEDIGYIEVHEDLDESVDIHVSDNGTTTAVVATPSTEEEIIDTVEVEPVCPDCGCEPCECEVAEGELEFDEDMFESVVNKHLDSKFKGSPKIKVESIIIKGKNLAINYSMTLGKQSSKGSLCCEGFDINKRGQKITLRDKGVITESVGKPSMFEARAIIGKGHLRIF